MVRKALVVWGGWAGHEPKPVAEIICAELERRNFAVTVSDTLDAFEDAEPLKTLNLIVPVWTMGTISVTQLNNVAAAVKSGVGIGGCHGGMCDAFRDATEWHFITGGQWVAHPGNSGVTYAVNITERDHFIMQGTSDFKITSEQYYMHTDPANKVLATTRFPTPGADGPHTTNGDVDMPVVWTKMYGHGRVFYSSIGHNAATVQEPDPLRILVRGLLWAARADG
ncbi:MAG TPA: ThuA domain-containing protein [Chthonomonadaceae bacterium]|nr:ThuA domain-containing protein [Chthonomonadaceae bacterium]